MKISQIMKHLDEIVDNVVNNWVNGNLTDSIELLKKLPPLAAAYVTALACERLGRSDSGMLIRRLQDEGITQIQEENDKCTSLNSRAR